MKLEDLITEEQLCEELGANKEQMARLRNQGLTFISLGVGVRLHDVNDVAKTLEAKKRRIGSGRIFKHTLPEK